MPVAVPAMQAAAFHLVVSPWPDLLGCLFQPDNGNVPHLKDHLLHQSVHYTVLLVTVFSHADAPWLTHRYPVVPLSA